MTIMKKRASLRFGREALFLLHTIPAGSCVFDFYQATVTRDSAQRLVPFTFFGVLTDFCEQSEAVSTRGSLAIPEKYCINRTFMSANRMLN